MWSVLQDDSNAVTPRSFAGSYCRKVGQRSAQNRTGTDHAEGEFLSSYSRSCLSRRASGQQPPPTPFHMKRWRLSSRQAPTPIKVESRIWQRLGVRVPLSH